MARTNPDKQKRRAAKQTLLMYGEGASEEAFLKHLKCLYARNSGVAVTVRNGKGGDPVSVVQRALREPGAFDRCVVVLDNDKSAREMRAARRVAGTNAVVLVEHTPCLEAMLLSVLHRGASYSHQASTWCKKEFEARYIEKKRRTDAQSYQTVFPKTLLDAQRVQITELDVLITFIEGK